MEGRAVALRVHERALRFHHRETRIVGWVCFIVRAVVCNAPNDFFWAIPAGKSSLGVRPVSFRLAAMAYGYFACSRL